jgi:two-component sensor histidine kinase
MADDVILCASELAANAALHSNSRLPGGTFTVRVIISSDHGVRIEVEDNGGFWPAAVGDHSGHHGLDIVRALATDWGYRRRPHRPHHLGSIRLAESPIAEPDHPCPICGDCWELLAVW